MNFFDIFLTSIYTHFCKMKLKRPRVIPWFQTCFVTALTATFCVVLAIRIIFLSNYKRINISEGVFMIIYLIIGCILFFIIKKYYFNSERHLILSEKYQEKYSEKKRLLFKVFSIGFCIILPFLLLYFVWFNAVK